MTNNNEILRKIIKRRRLAKPLGFVKSELFMLGGPHP